MRTFQLEMREMHAFHFEMHKTADFHLKLLVSWELVTEGHQGRPLNSAHFIYFKLIERLSPVGLFTGTDFGCPRASTKKMFSLRR